MWLKAKNIQLNRLLKKLDQKRYRSFRISKDISQKVFQLELLEEWTIYNVFNKDLMTQCGKPQFKEQCIDLASPPDIIIKKKNIKWKKYKTI